MEWINIKDCEPTGNYDVLVATNLYDDDYWDYFVASYFKGEREWHICFTLPMNKKANHVRLQIPIRKTDRWIYLHEFGKL